MNIRARLTLLILSVLLPAFAAGALAVWFVYGEGLEAQERSLSEATRVLAQLIDSEMESSEKFLSALSSSPDLADGNLERFHSHAKALSNNGQRTIVLSTLQGQQILNTRLSWGPLDRSINPRLLDLRRHTDPHATIVSDLFFAPLGKRFDFAVQVPVIINGALRYYISLGTEAKVVQRFLGKQGFPENWIASVVDKQGILIARSHHSASFVGKAATGTLAKKILARVSQGVNDGVSLDGKRVKAFFYRAQKSGWTVVLSVPTTELNRPALQAALLLTALMFVTLMAALALAQRYSARTLVPVQRLSVDAQRLGRGEPVHVHQSGVAELDVVNAVLVRASEDLRNTASTMERRIADAIESTERAQRALLHSQKLEALGRLTAGVAHDFNNILQTLTSALQLIGLERNPEKIPSRLAICEKAVGRASSLVAQLRAFGRAQTGYMMTIGADEAVKSGVSLLTNSLPSTIRLELVVEQAVWAITVDLPQFELALLNLVLNARDAIAGQGTIKLRVANHTQKFGTGPLRAGDFVCIEVSDNGAGMSADVLAKAFDPFYTTKPVDKGSGLGLPQAYGFANQSGGTLILESTPGIGTVARLYLPRVESLPGAAPAPAHLREPMSIRLDAVVLFVEDDKLVRDSVAPILAQAGAELLCASNADEALQILHERTDIDILFTDIVMPGARNGVMLARYARDNFPGMGVVLATGNFNGEINIPEARVLTKPYHAQDALRALADAIPSLKH